MDQKRNQVLMLTAHVEEFIQFCKFIFGYTFVLTILNVVLLHKDLTLLLIFSSTLPAIVSYYGFKFLTKNRS